MKKNYFAVTSVLLVLFSVIGFSDNLFFNVHQTSNSDPKFIVHGLFMFAWFLILMIQTLFIRKGDTKSHIRWGTAGFLAAAGTVISTFYVFAAVYKGWDAMPFFAKANRFFMPSFGLFVWLGYRNRQKPVLHKHYIFLGSFFLLEPILAWFPLDFLSDPEFDVFLFGTWSLFFCILFSLRLARAEENLSDHLAVVSLGDGGLCHCHSNLIRPVFPERIRQKNLTYHIKSTQIQTFRVVLNHWSNILNL